MRLKKEDGILYCSFSRPAQLDTYAVVISGMNPPTSQNVTINQLTTNYYLLVAVGPAYSKYASSIRICHTFEGEN